jgi:hypothetical protein
VALGFWDIPGGFSVVGEFARVGVAKVLALEDQDKVAAVVIPRRSKKPARRGALLQYFFGVVGPSFLLGVLAKTGGRTWFFDGEFVVDCW